MASAYRLVAALLALLTQPDSPMNAAWPPARVRMGGHSYVIDPTTSADLRGPEVVAVSEVAPGIGTVDLPDGYLDYDDYIERCCHVLKAPKGTSSAAMLPRTLCGLTLRRLPHVMRGNSETCSDCGRPRCPDCAHRYGQGQR